MDNKYRLGCVVFLFIATLLHAQWESTIDLSESNTVVPAHAWSISSSFGGMVHVVWSDIRDINPVVYYKRSTDYGNSWEDEIRFVDTESNAENPGVSIAGVMNPVVHVIWDDDRDGNKEIYYKRSSDWGVTWSNEIRLTNTPGASVQPNLHGCVCCGADIRIVWIEEHEGYAWIYYKSSDDNGLSWSDDVCISAFASVKEHPNISFCRADVQVIWTDHRNGKHEIWGSHSTDQGATWEPEILLSHEDHVWAGYATIAHVDSIYYVMWPAHAQYPDPSGNGVYFRSTNDLGLTWSPIQRIVTHEKEYVPFISCAAMKENLHITWGVPEQGLYYKRSIDKGVTWQDMIELEESAGARFPCTAISGKCVHIVWSEKSSEGTTVHYMRDPQGNPVGESE